MDKTLGAGRIRSTTRVFKAARTFSTQNVCRLTVTGERLILGIETSCDDTCASIVAAPSGYSPSSFASTLSHPLDGHRPVARLVNSIVQRQDHSMFKGIEPLVAQNYHMKAIPNVIKHCLREGEISADGREIDAIAVTQGPGMPGCLGVGLTAAKTLAALWDKPLIPVHHMEAHALTPFLTHPENSLPVGVPPLKYPFLTLLLSGGHTMLVLARGFGTYKILATTLDESIGDAYDKTARLLNITTNWTKESPGASLEAFAAEHTASAANIAQTLPAIPGYKRPFVDKPFFSYSGIKSAIRRHIEQLASTDHARSARREGEKVKSPKVGEASSVPIEERQKWAAAFQKAALDQIEDKLKLVLAASTPPRPSSASDDQSKIAQQWRNGIATEEQMALLLQDIRRSQHLVVSGGVASNQELRRRLAEFWRVEEGRHLLFPPIQLCVDNAAMIAHVGALLYHDAVEKHAREPTAAFDALPRSRWSLEDLRGSH